MIEPTLPGALGRLLFAPMPAARLTALRIGAGLLLFLDLVVSYWPHQETLLGPRGYVGEPGVGWSLMRVLPAEHAGRLVLALGTVASAALALNVAPRLAALAAWAVTVSLWNHDFYLHNGGDRLRPLFFLILMFVPKVTNQTEVSGWPAKLLLIQVCCVYFFAGWAKLFDPAWVDGSAMRSIAANPQWSMAPGAAAAVPAIVWKLSTWGTLVWELGFVALVVLPRPRYVVLVIGIVFHVATLFLLDVGLFALWTPACYLPLLPWERLSRGRFRRNACLDEPKA